MKPDEVSKFQAEYIRHLNTLSTGALVLIIGFLEKILTNPEWKILVVISIGAFILSIVSAVISYTADVLFPGELEKDAPKWLQPFMNVAIVVCWAGFLTGIITLGVFGMKNLL